MDGVQSAASLLQLVLVRAQQNEQVGWVVGVRDALSQPLPWEVSRKSQNRCSRSRCRRSPSLALLARRRWTRLPKSSSMRPRLNGHGTSDQFSFRRGSPCRNGQCQAASRSTRFGANPDGFPRRQRVARQTVHLVASFSHVPGLLPPAAQLTRLGAPSGLLPRRHRVARQMAHLVESCGHRPGLLKTAAQSTARRPYQQMDR